MRVLLAFLTLLSLHSCADSQALIGCEQNRLNIDGESVDLSTMSLEKVNGEYNLAVNVGSELFQIRFGKGVPKAVMINFESAPMESGPQMELDYMEKADKVSMQSSGTLVKGDKEQSFKICVKDMSYESKELIEE